MSSKRLVISVEDAAPSVLHVLYKRCRLLGVKSSLCLWRHQHQMPCTQDGKQRNWRFPGQLRLDQSVLGARGGNERNGEPITGFLSLYIEKESIEYIHLVGLQDLSTSERDTCMYLGEYSYSLVAFVWIQQTCPRQDQNICRKYYANSLYYLALALVLNIDVYTPVFHLKK